MTIDETKTLLQSKTVWSALVAFAAGLAGILGYGFDPEDQGRLVDLITGIASALGGIGAVYGRTVARKSIGK